MNKLISLSALLLASGACLADDVGRVLSSTPIVQQVGVPRQVCSTEQVAVQSPKSGAGAVMGAIAGGAMGNAVGRGAGNAAATMLGLVSGAIVGDRIEGAPPAQLQNVQHCSTQTFYENRTVGFNVSYLLDFLSNIKTENVRWSIMPDANASALLTLPDDESFRYVVMPMRI